MSLNILIIEDESLAAKHLEMAFRRKGYNPTVAGTARDGLEAARAVEPDIVLLDLNLPDRSGLDVLPELKRDFPRCEVVVNTGMSDVDVAVQAMRAGAFDFVVKPLNLDAILLTVERVLAARELKQENRFLREQYESQFSLENVGIYGPVLAEVFENATRFAPRELPVLIQGESGTGKELVARHIHARSSPQGKGPGPFIPINCSALPVSLAESEFFGYGPGAFTGAERKGKPGKFSAADGGSIFLDEVGELVPEVQAKLLRFLETKCFYPVGLNREIKVDVKVICATNRNLAEEVAAGRFRKDLFFRINVGLITIPPLRERKREILPLVGQFLREFSAAYRRPRIKFTTEAEKILEQAA
jgi:DNA-binding NtrC family response regulator